LRRWSRCRGWTVLVAVSTSLKMQMGRTGAARWTGLLCFNIRTGGCIKVGFQRACQMKRYRIWRLIVLAMLLGIGAVYFMWPPPDQVYRGKRMSQWMRELERDPSTESVTCRALSEGGSQVVPMVVEGLHSRDDSRLYFWLWPKLPISLQNRFPRPQYRNSYRYCCEYILGKIEPSTPDIVRELRQTLRVGDSGSARFAAQALRMIAEREPRMRGEVAKALPDLRKWAAISGAHTNQVVRSIQIIEGLKVEKYP
jgi:hypothetical protein